MHALIADPGHDHGWRQAEVPDPEPGPGQVLVEVHHAALNLGEVQHLGFQPPGAVLGFDAAGVVVRAATDGTGPAAGTRVLTFGAGTWARLAAFDASSVAAVCCRARAGRRTNPRCSRRTGSSRSAPRARFSPLGTL